MLGQKKNRFDRNSGSLVADSFLVRVVAKVVIGVIVVVTALTLAQCTINTPAAPKWSTTFGAPLLNQTYSMVDLIDRLNDSTIKFDSDGDPYFGVVKDVDSFGVSPNTQTTSVNQRALHVVGLVDIKPGATDPQIKPFSEIIGAAGVVPPTNFGYVYDPPALSEYTSVTVASGALYIAITNNLGLFLDNISLDVFDLGTFQPVGGGALGSGIWPGVTDTVVVQLAGKTISNQLRVQVAGHTTGGTVLVSGANDLTLQVDFSDPLSISSGNAKIPSITRIASKTFDLGVAHQVVNATVGSGTLDLLMQNVTSLTTNMSMTLADFQDGGSPLVISRTLAPYSQQIVSAPLAGMLLAPIDQSMPQILTLQTAANIDSSGSNMVTVYSSDSMSVTATMSQLIFTNFVAVIDADTTVISPVTQSIDVPSELSSSQLTGVVMTLEIDNGSALEGLLELTVLGSNGKSFPLSGLIAPGGLSSPVTSFIVEDSLADFFNPIPATIAVSGIAIMGDGVTSTAITAQDFIRARVRIESPLEAVFPGSMVTADIERSGVDSASARLFADHVAQAVVSARIVNHLPVGVEVQILLSSDSATLYSAPELILGPITVLPGVIDAQGLVIDTTVSTSVIAIDSADATVFLNTPIFVGQRLTLTSPNGQSVRLRGSDYVSVRATIEADFTFDGTF